MSIVFPVERRQFVGQTRKRKYVIEKDNYFLKVSRTPKGWSFWRSYSKIGELFKRMTRIQVGKGKSVSFCHDRWCSKYPLVVLFPFSYASIKKALSRIFVVEHAYPNWNLHLLRRLSFHTISYVSSISLIQNRIVLEESEDLILWDDGNDVFNVRTCMQKNLQLRLKFSCHGVINLHQGKVWLKGVSSMV